MSNIQLATFGGGCFWCIESALNAIRGVQQAVSGYSGGQVDNPTYQQICSGQTGHAEVIQVTFDADIISYDLLLDFFFQLHDPTQLNRQGNDVGTQYRSIILYHDEVQRQTAINKISDVHDHDIWDGDIVTEVEPISIFYPAEEYHQGYAENNPQQPYCALVVNPKLNKFKQKFSDFLK
ncbi:peptide-methionine (S)-S-oxide reductase MsrA [Psychrosphaera sp. B3R10]|uniref:Peptide methionine sulfoxide reductase MsrA n=1 Tax=Psychrosphaera algicola TaxID=3023714 RepID=A0ABT5FI58_9GAMM|nr:MULTISPECIES: peptide-methionine (S)-S-oxide reductase MsrA [unclassified Psychrosphaera]MBU2881584.1 peptide-methionine (S)-S-oxide reductase MsrA [Psychrosphaera sp. I2R16]MBU2991161.1 peptide-methionine (S)-S-oxide reductase MsrA [Psychrosphaera sp. B3R10]MDC2890876.1 peptide-methionine (S)-S-oxide reductase MsrA [Psychrosphaera sp. G1-22]MDO6719508.1 peptide-methionine (S)-S-oxide reductase MsrA [Psychrosphaera sp. 1_MG-2023]